MSEFVSVVMAVYNDRPEHLAAALASILQQDYDGFELIVVDESTSPSSADVLSDCAASNPSRFRLIRPPVRGGFVRSLNLGIAAARGELIARMDGDDIAVTRRLAMQADFLRLHPEIGIVGSHLILIDAEGSELGVRRYRTAPANLRKYAFVRNPLAHPSVMMRRSVLSRIGLYDERFKKVEDYDLWLRALRLGVAIGNVDDLLLRYRVTANYSAKRNRLNTLYTLQAKWRNVSWRYPMQTAIGIGINLAMLAAPRRLIDRIYDRDARRPILHA